MVMQGHLPRYYLSHFSVSIAVPLANNPRIMQAKHLIEQVQALPEAEQWEVVMAILSQLKAQTAPQSPGDPMSMEAFQQRIAQAEADIEAGRVYNRDEVRKRMREWK